MTVARVNSVLVNRGEYARRTLDYCMVGENTPGLSCVFVNGGKAFPGSIEYLYITVEYTKGGFCRYILV